MRNGREQKAYPGRVGVLVANGLNVDTHEAVPPHGRVPDRVAGFCARTQVVRSRCGLGHQRPGPASLQYRNHSRGDRTVRLKSLTTYAAIAGAIAAPVAF